MNLVTIYYLIWFSLYLIYFFSIWIDWNYVEENSQLIVWGAFWISIAALLVVGILTVMYMRGYPFERFGGRGLFLTGAFFLIITLSILFYQHWSWKQNYHTVREKARRRVYRPLEYQYGRDSQDLAQQFQIRRSAVLNRIEPQSLHELWEILMVHSPEQITRLLTEILGDYPRDTIDVQYNLLWYLCIANEPLRNNLSKYEVQYILSLDTPTLLQLVRDGVRPIPTIQTRYEGLTDRASLIFTLLSGYFIPVPENLHRYDEIKKYSPHIIYNLAFNQYQIIDHTNATYQVYPPHIYVAQQPESPVEKIISQITPENCNQMIEGYQIAPLAQVQSLSFEQKLKMLQRELSLYHNVFSRPEGMVIPPPLNNLTDSEIYNILSYYTNLELIANYEPRRSFRNRNELLQVIHDDVVGAPRWSLYSIQYCNNDATMNVITGELHGEMNKSDPTDPTLSYGNQKNYKCYQVSELEGSFREYNGIFQFRVPDYLPNTNEPAQFPIESIKQLKSLLEQEATNVLLLQQINTGLQAMKSARVQTLMFKQQYEGFNSQQQGLIRKYLAWMFIYAMWMRFWKGPGHPWPMKKVMVNFALTRSLGKRASPQHRDEHVFIQEAVRTRLIEQAEADPALHKWLTSLIAVHYDFSSGDSHCASYTIHEKMNEIALGNECMGFGSDIILKTAYYYILFLLGVQDGPSFDSFIYNQLPSLLDLEREVITQQLQTVIGRGNTTRVEVMNNRLDVLALPLPIQSSFDPKQYETNVHV